jgi:uncharacterized protein YjbI with pentapeptide repeats
MENADTRETPEAKNTPPKEEEAFLFPKEYWEQGQAPANAQSIFDIPADREKLSEGDFSQLDWLTFQEFVKRDPAIAKEWIEVRIAINNGTKLTKEQVGLIMKMNHKNLSNADLSGHNLYGSSNADAIIRLIVDKMDDGTDISKFDLLSNNLWEKVPSDHSISGNSFQGGEYRGTNFSDAKFTYGTCWDKVDCTKANFSNANIPGVHFWGTNLENANFINANLQIALFSETNLEGANFSGANLKHAKFHNTNHEKANFEGAMLEGAEFINDENKTPQEESPKKGGIKGWFKKMFSRK